MKTPARRPVLLLSASVAAFALAGCQDTRTEARSYASLDACLADISENAPSSADCNTAWLEAEALHAQSAPRYASQDLCVEEHGPEMCVAQADSGGSVFMPFLMGYMMGRTLSPDTSLAARSQPLYSTANGRFATASGAYSTQALGTTALTNASSFARPAVTAGQPAMTRATVTARGGFGSARASSGG